jgi:hypothetical protein
MVMERTRMNSKRGVTWGLLAAAAACIAIAAMPGCELLVDFDRSKIPTGGDASAGEEGGTLPDATMPSDAPGEGSNTLSDVLVPGKDATSEGGDASVGGSGDAGSETGAPDTGGDATEVETGADSGPDAVADGGGPEAGD